MLQLDSRRGFECHSSASYNTQVSTIAYLSIVEQYLIEIGQLLFSIQIQEEPFSAARANWLVGHIIRDRWRLSDC